MNVIKLAIGSGILLLSCGAYSQSISEKTNSDKKGAAEFSPLSVSVGKTTSEQENRRDQFPDNGQKPAIT